VVDAVLPPRERICWYPVTTGLQLEERSWVKRVGPGDLVVFITYFGFDTWSQVGRDVIGRGGIVVEDAAQAMLGELAGFAHYSVVSPRKFLGVPDGGILVAQGGTPPREQELVFHAEWWLKAFCASQQRRDFDERGGDRQWYRLFQEFEPVGPLEPARMSELSSTLLEFCADFELIAKRRRANYRQLLGALRDFAIFTDLPDEVVPLGFPVRLTNRDQLRQRLFQSEIYPPVHWPVGRVVPPDFHASHELENVILTLPCDQRYGQDDMQRMIECFVQAANDLCAKPVAAHA
jgi:hypothetical protein